MANQFDVFLAYNTADREAVEAIAEQLRFRGLKPWLDTRELPPGRPFSQGIENGLREAQAVAVCVGHAGLGAWQRSEMEAALGRAHCDNIPVIPVLLPGCPPSQQLSLFLETRTWVDFRKGPTEDEFERLIWGITSARMQGGVPPSAPATPRAPAKRHSRARPPARLLLPATAAVVLGALLWCMPRFPQLYAVRVQVFDAHNVPLRGTHVTATAGHEPQLLPDGWWQIEIPAAKVPLDRKITIWAEHPEWLANDVAVQLGTDPNPNVKILLKQPESLIQGSVVDNHGRPLSNVQVTCEDCSAGTAITDPQGHYLLKLTEPSNKKVSLRFARKGYTAEQEFGITGARGFWTKLYKQGSR